MIKEAREVLKRYYGYDNFREGQGDIIEQILSGRDVLRDNAYWGGEIYLLPNPSYYVRGNYYCGIAAYFSYERSGRFFGRARSECGLY